MRHAGAAERARADSGKAANELRYALRGKDKDIERLQAELQKARDSAATDLAAAVKHGKAMAQEAEGRAERAAADLKEKTSRVSKLTAELDAMRREVAARDAELRTLREQQQQATKPSGGSDAELRKAAEREAAARAQAEARLKEVKERLERQQTRNDELRKGAAPAAASVTASSSGSSPSQGEDEDLRRQLNAAIADLAALRDEFEKKKEAWRISSLKRHAETNKLEQALKVSTTNEGLLKKKADMLELTVLSHQKSMDKGRASIVREQLKEHNERLEQQSGCKDLHASATQRKTFQETYTRQMDALEGKLSKLK